MNRSLRLGGCVLVLALTLFGLWLTAELFETAAPAKLLTFDARVWADESLFRGEHYPFTTLRARMLDDLLAHHLPPGSARADVERLLARGPYDTVGERESRYHVDMGSSSDLGRYLVLRYDETGALTSAAVAELRP